MSTVFTINQSWFNRPAVYEQLAFASSGDAIVLIEDAVLALQSPISLASFLAKCERLSINVYYLINDCRLRGIDIQYSHDQSDLAEANTAQANTAQARAVESNAIQAIDYAGFVALVADHAKHVAW